MFWFFVSLFFTGATLALFLISVTLVAALAILNQNGDPSREMVTMNHQEIRNQILANALFLKPSPETIDFSTNHCEIVIACSWAPPSGYVDPERPNDKYQALTAHVVGRGRSGTPIIIEGQRICSTGRDTFDPGTLKGHGLQVTSVKTLDALINLYSLTCDLVEKKIQDELKQQRGSARGDGLPGYSEL